MKDQTIIDNEAENKDLHNASEEKEENKDLRNASYKKEKKKEKEKKKNKLKIIIKNYHKNKEFIISCRNIYILKFLYL